MIITKKNILKTIECTCHIVLVVIPLTQEDFIRMFAIACHVPLLSFNKLFMHYFGMAYSTLYSNICM